MWCDTYVWGGQHQTTLHKRTQSYVTSSSLFFVDTFCVNVRARINMRVFVTVLTICFIFFDVFRANISFHQCARAVRISWTWQTKCAVHICIHMYVFCAANDVTVYKWDKANFCQHQIMFMWIEHKKASKTLHNWHASHFILVCETTTPDVATSHYHFRFMHFGYAMRLHDSWTKCVSPVEAIVHSLMPQNWLVYWISAPYIMIQ